MLCKTLAGECKGHYLAFVCVCVCGGGGGGGCKAFGHSRPTNEMAFRTNILKVLFQCSLLCINLNLQLNEQHDGTAKDAPSKGCGSSGHGDVDKLCYWSDGPLL